MGVRGHLGTSVFPDSIMLLSDRWIEPELWTSVDSWSPENGQTNPGEWPAAHAARRHEHQHRGHRSAEPEERWGAALAAVLCVRKVKIASSSLVD